MSKKVPWIGGADKLLDPYFWSRRTYPTLADIPDTSPDYGDLYFKSAFSKALAEKWFWRVREWKLNGTADWTNVVLGTSVSLSVVDLPFRYFRREGFFAGDPVTEIADESLMLDYFKDLTKGNTGLLAVPHPTTTGFGWSFAGNQAAFDTAGMADYVTIGATLVSDPAAEFSVIFQSILSPNFWFGPQPLIASRMASLEGEDTIRPSFYFRVQLGHIVTGAFDSGSFASTAFAFEFPDQIAEDIGNIALDAQNVVISSKDDGSSKDADFTLIPSKFWAFKNSAGLPVYDEDTGAQLNDPFS